MLNTYKPTNTVSNCTNIRYVCLIKIVNVLMWILP